MFYLGTHKAHWLKLVDVPLFLSHRTLRTIKSLPRALAPWALDSGGFSELSLYGEWQTTPKEYVKAVKRYHDAIGLLQFASIQDWMCEDFMLKKTGKTMLDHQTLTIDSFLELSCLAPGLPWLPVIQGFALADYARHVQMYMARGIDLSTFDRVGIGSVCRREGTKEAESIIRLLTRDYKLKLHGFGFKLNGLKAVGHLLASADSMAWSINARLTTPIAGHTHKTCANCLEFALNWRAKVEHILSIARIENGKQRSLFELMEVN